MDATFETIGLEVPSEKAINFLAERAENQGEPTQLLRQSDARSRQAASMLT